MAAAGKYIDMIYGMLDLFQASCGIASGQYEIEQGNIQKNLGSSESSLDILMADAKENNANMSSSSSAWQNIGQVFTQINGNWGSFVAPISSAAGQMV